ncbi:hypothetical protein AAVH_30527 [Aphelenchoides avenae]|nr:hypothetical protein AAVH_30527 [Aphelenchus avenae]
MFLTKLYQGRFQDNMNKHLGAQKKQVAPSVPPPNTSASVFQDSGIRQRKIDDFFASMPPPAYAPPPPRYDEIAFDEVAAPWNSRF